LDLIKQVIAVHFGSSTRQRGVFDVRLWFGVWQRRVFTVHLYFGAQ
jgi:uncharacterized protein YjlB